MSVEDDARIRKSIHDYWDERLKREVEEAAQMSRLRIAEDYETRPWYIRLIDWLAR